MGSNSSRQNVRTSTASETETSQSVDVEIKGRRLTVRTDRDPEFIRELADYVDGKLRELGQAAPAAPTDKLLLMATMTMAEELFEARSEVEALQDEIERRAETLNQILDQLDDTE